MTARHITAIIALAAALAAATATQSCLKATADDQKTDIDNTTLLNVITNPTLDTHLIHYDGMDVNFNPTCHIPNWVAWELTRDETKGTHPRTNRFYSDPSIPGCAETYDYAYSGYDRGHMAPAGDMKWSREAMIETFCLTNIAPQAKALNTGAWKKLEEKCRLWANIDSAIYIVTGPVLTDKPIEYIGDTRVFVPRRYFKVIISPHANPPRGIGFIMPNSKVPGGIQQCALTIDQVEEITGHDFFSSLPDQLENQIESQNDFNLWSTMR